MLDQELKCKTQASPMDLMEFEQVVDEYDTNSGFLE